MTNSAGNASFSQAPRDPNMAACLSLMPGLGQLYNGQSRKGSLFLAVSVINVFIFLLIITNQYIIRGLFGFGQAFHMRPNQDLLSALAELHLGSSLSLIIFGLLFAFIIYAIRDAYDNASTQQRRQIYPEYAMEMPEATSSSYLLHFGLLILFFLLAIFFLKQSRPPAQITDIEFVTNQPPTQKKIQSVRRAEHNSEAAGKHENKPVVAPSPAPKSPSKAAPKATPQKAPPQPVPKPMPTPAPHPSPIARPVPVPIPHPTAAPSPSLMPTIRPMPMPSPMARPTASPSPNPSPMPAPSLAHRGNPSPAPAPKLGTGPIITGGPGPAPVAVSAGNGGGNPSPMPVPVGGGGASSSHGGSSPAPAPAPTRGGSHGGGGGGPVLISPSVPRQSGGGGEGVRGNPDANSNPGKAPAVSAQADVDFGPYMADLQRRIKRAWFPPKGNESKRVVVIFKVHRGGELSNLRLDHASGVAIADQAALKAIENAAPFRPLPAGAADDVDIQFTFDYNVFSGGGSGLFRKF